MKKLVLYLFSVLVFFIPSLSFAYTGSINNQVIPVFTAWCSSSGSGSFADYCVYSIDPVNFRDFFFYNVVLTVFWIYLIVKFFRLFYNFLFK